MAIWLQHLLVLSLAFGCLGFVSWQGLKAMRGKQSRIGSCCTKGCGHQEPLKKPENRVAFLPAELLGRRR